MRPGIQEWIHKFEVGEGVRYIKAAAVLLGLLALTVVYDLREFKNFSTQEAMDVAQLARNLAEGKGYTTDFIRPLSLHLLQETRGDTQPALKQPHPDLANPPVYPFILGGLMRVLPFHFDIIKGTQFWRYQPEMLIAIFNQGLFYLAIFLVFRLALRLFDNAVAWVSALIFAGTKLFWRFSVSGLSTMLLVVIFLAIVWCLVELEDRARTATGSHRRYWMLSLVVGALVGIGGLTRYSFAWLILPILGFIVLFLGQRRVGLSAAVLGAFLVVMAPWLFRNYQKCGAAFGTAGFALYQDTLAFRGDRLERFLTKDFEAELSRVEFDQIVRKLLVNSSSIVEKDLPTLAGNWTSAFFLVGLLLPFRSAALNRTRAFVLMSLGVFVIVQALGKSYLSSESPEINSENLLVLLAPMVFVFGVGMYFVLLDQVNLPFPQVRSVVTIVFGLLVCAPLIFSLAPPRSVPIAYHPYAAPDDPEPALIRYWPPGIQDISRWLREDELMMSDMPWAVAWYGDRQCVWVTLDAPMESMQSINSDFYALNDYQKPVSGLYLTALTLDARFYSQIIKDRGYDWGRFMLQSMLRTNVPKGFPLKYAPPGFMRYGQLFLSDRERWDKPSH